MASEPESQPPSSWPSERWNRIDELLQSALELHPRQRTAYLREACAGDQSLLREVESLLASHEQPEVSSRGPRSTLRRSYS
jgi:hypothetical protein